MKPGCPQKAICDAMEACAGRCSGDDAVKPAEVKDFMGRVWKFVMHLRYDAGGYGYRYQHQTFPRVILCVDRASRKAPEQRRFLVDDVERQTLEEVVAALNAPAPCRICDEPAEAGTDLCPLCREAFASLKEENGEDAADARD